MKFTTLVSPALAALTVFAGLQARAADTMVSLALAPATEVVTLSPHWSIGPNLSGFHQMAQDLGIGGVANDFYSIKGTVIPSGGDVLAFNYYVAASGAATPHADIGSKLTPDSYSALTSADPDVGYGAVNLYFIHHKGTTDYFSVIVPGPAVSSAVTDLKPMSGPGGPATVTGVGGYKGLTFAAANLGYGLNNFYYFRTNPDTTTSFGALDPALLASSADKFNLGIGNYSALAFTGTAVTTRYGANKMYYVRQDMVNTGFSIFGTLDPLTGKASDMANLGSVYATLTFVVGDLSLGGGNQFYTTGTLNPTWQSISFGAIADRLISAGSFTVTPQASSGLTIALTVTGSSTGAATITGPAAGVFTVTPTAPGLIILQATQAGDGTHESNNLRQSFTVTGAATIAPSITNLPATVTSSIGAPISFALVATQSPISYANLDPLPLNLVLNTTTGVITGSPTTAGSTAVRFTATNGFGTSANATLTISVGAAGAAPVITNNPLTAAATVGAPFNFLISASNSPTSYSASPLPAGLVRNAATGAITGTPLSAGVTAVLLGATNTNGVGNATLTITVVPAGFAPVIINNPITAAGTVGVPFSFTTTASNSPASYSASPLPAGLTAATGTGAITGTPTTVGTTVVLLGASNSFGTGTSTLTITVAPAAVAPIITNSPLTAAGTIGTPFGFTITASGLPTSYAASPLPAGLSIVAATGVITGTPTTTGTTVVTLTATNSTGTGTSTLTITVAPAAVAPIITSPTSAPGTVGTPFVTYLIAATGLPTSYTAFNLPPGLTLNPLTGAINGTPTAAGTTFVTLTAVNSAGTSTATLMIVIAPAAVAPIITSPTSATGAVGSTFVTFPIVATGLPTSYTATGLPPGLTVNALTGTINGTPTAPGNYVVTITATNALGTSTASLLITVGPNLSSRIMNFSARAVSGPGDQALIMGFVVAGNGKNLLVRGIGPTLANFGVVNFLADPLLTLYNANTAIATNDDWSINSSGVDQSALIAATAARVGAFALPAGSKDSALLVTVNNGAHTSGLLRPNSTTGVALTEIYDTDTTLGARLINVSARMNVGTGEGTLIAGFSIGGTVPKTVLIRGIGPTLSVFGVSGVLADPQIAVYSGSTLVASNDNWEVGTSTAAQLASASAQVGAFALPSGSKDASLLVTLQPGTYSVLVTGVGGTTGVALIEIYDTQ